MARAAALTGSDQAVVAGSNLFFGYSVRETGGSAATAIIYDGTSATGTILATVGLASGASDTKWFGPQGIRASLGIYVDVGGSGTVQGSVFLG